jgi:hypothetical protein
MATVKTIVKRRMKELGWGPYDLAMAVKPHVSAPTIYNFLRRKAEVNSKTLGHVLEALGLEIRPKR